MEILESESRSLREYRLLPRHTPRDGGMAQVELSTRLCAQGDGFITLQLPVLSAAMQAVTGPELAIALAQLGGIGVLPVSQSIDAQCAALAAVKRYKAGFQTSIEVVSAHQRIAEVVALMARTGFGTFPVTDNGLFHGKLIGVLTDKDFDPRMDLECCVADRMRKDVQVGVELDDLAAANSLMVRYGRGFLPIVSQEGTLLSVVFKRDRDKHLDHPRECVDAQRRLRVAAAVSTHPEDRERVCALVEHEVDALVIDASDGHTQFQADMLAFVRSRGDVPVIAGNVVTAEGFGFLADAGADAVKVGMGIGSGCTTQEVKATGRGQASALPACRLDLRWHPRARGRAAVRACNRRLPHDRGASHRCRARAPVRREPRRLRDPRCRATRRLTVCARARSPVGPPMLTTGHRADPTSRLPPS